MRKVKAKTMLLPILMYSSLVYSCVVSDFEPDKPRYSEGKNALSIFPRCAATREDGTVILNPPQYPRGYFVELRLLSTRLTNRIEQSRAIECNVEQTLVRYDETFDLFACVRGLDNDYRRGFDFWGFYVYPSDMPLGPGLATDPERNRNLDVFTPENGRCFCADVRNSVVTRRSCYGSFRDSN